MMQLDLGSFFDLGMNIEEVRTLLDYLKASAGKDLDYVAADEVHVKIMDNEERAKLKGVLEQAILFSDILDMPASGQQMRWLLNDLPETPREVKLVMSMFRAELISRVVVCIPQHVSRYYENDALVSELVKVAFPTATAEVRADGNALAAGLATACVFHAMRAVEIGVRSLGQALALKLKHPVGLADWQAILTATRNAVEVIGKEPRSAERDQDLQFFSVVGAQFQFFKDGWRVRAAHARETFNEMQAKDALDHVLSFFETISLRLKEAP